MARKKAPPAPPKNRSPKGHGDDKRASIDNRQARGDASTGGGANEASTVGQNTTHQDHQQDR